MKKNYRTVLFISTTLNAFLRTSLFLLFIISWSCRKFIEVKNSKTELLEGTVFESDQPAISATVGLYARMNAATFTMFCGGVSVFAGLAADEIINSTANSTYDPFSKNSLLSNTSTISSRFWNYVYPIIYHCNATIEGLNKSNSVTDSLKKRLIGEAKLVRAFSYFNLVNLFGDVPLAISTDYRINSKMTRTPASLVYEQIIEDLKYAESSLPSVITNNNERPNKWAAKALLARVYLYQKKYPEAESEATSVINSGVFHLESNLNNVFLVNSKETVWQIMPVGTALMNSPEGNIYIPSSATARPTFSLTSFLLNAFETNDQRKTNWTKNVVVSGQTYYYPFKFKVRTNASVIEANILLRLAEQYLIRAEARTYQNKLTGGNSAEFDLNLIRNRGGLTNTTAISQGDFLTAIEKERQTELFSEWGHRWFDLKRWDRANAILGINKSPNWNATDALWPIPLSEININVFLSQNPGY